MTASSRLKRAAACFLLATSVLAVVGCGSASGPSGEEWAQEVVNVMKDAKKRGITSGEEEIASASTRPQLEAAYLSYSTQLRSLVGAIEGTHAPSECEGFKERTAGFVRKLSEITEKLADQKALVEDESKYAKLAREENSVSKKFASEVEQISKGGKCES